MSTGGGGGIQPGGLLAINVDLYNDADPATPGLQSKLVVVLHVDDAERDLAADGDEPAALAVDGHNVYIVNGGLNAFFVASAEILRGSPARSRVISASSSPTRRRSIRASPSLSARGIIDSSQRLRRRRTRRRSPGLACNFPNNVMFPWGPSGDKRRVGHESASVQRGVRRQAVRHRDQSESATRAIVPYFQTGNFGVMDSSSRTPEAVAASGIEPPQALASLSTDMFQAVFAVTQALLLDNALWPVRGAFSPGDLGVRMPSPTRT